MRKFLLLMALAIGFVLVCPSKSKAQCVDSFGVPNWISSWIQQGGQMPQPLAMAVLRKAEPWAQQNFGMHLGHLLHKWRIGQLTIVYLQTMPQTSELMFRVSYGGIDITILDDSF